MTAPSTRLSRLSSHHPVGGTLPAEEFDRRHLILCRLLWLGVPGILVYGLIEGGYELLHQPLHALPVVAFALLASLRLLSSRLRAVSCSLGLLTLASLGVHISHGTIEAHFAFFVFIVALTVYEDWWPFLVSVAYVLLHHGVLGMIEPQEVFSQPEQFESPWKWAAIHAIFVAGAGTAGVIAWRLNERVASACSTPSAGSRSSPRPTLSPACATAAA